VGTSKKSTGSLIPLQVSYSREYHIQRAAEAIIRKLISVVTETSAPIEFSRR
jgi:hypothetical protein